MAAQKPSIVKRNEERTLPGKHRQQSQIEVPAVEVVQMNNIWEGLKTAKETTPGRKMKVLIPKFFLYPRPSIGKNVDAMTQPPHTSVSILDSAEPTADLSEKVLNKGFVLWLRNCNDTFVRTPPVAHRKSRIMSLQAIGAKKLVRYLFSSAANVRGVDLKNVH
jgi:hypothetical protein